MRFRVEPDQLGELDAALTEVLAHLRAATPAGHGIAAPGDEPVSVDAARRLGEGMATLHHEANRAHRKVVEAAAEAFGATRALYTAREGENKTSVLGAGQ
jgi:hypothetical protein